VGKGKDREQAVWLAVPQIDEGARGLGLARKLYEELFDLVRSAGHVVIACEVNSQPPNPGSDAFHAAMGFVEAGTASPAPGKTVRLAVQSDAITPLSAEPN